MNDRLTMERIWTRLVMRRRSWWLPLLIVMSVGVGSMLYVGSRTYQDAPPIPDFVTASGERVLAHDEIVRGQIVFQKYALMDYGSFFGDGAARGTDFTAEALREGVLAAIRHYAAGAPAQSAEHDAAVARVQREYRQNRWDAASNQVVLSEGQVQAHRALVHHYQEMFAGRGPQAFHPAGYISDATELRDLAGFFFWGAWVCAAERPGADYSYTHNWPYDELAGNRPSPPVLYWSVAAALGLILALGVVLYLYGRYGQASGWNAGNGTGKALPATSGAVDAYEPTPLQRISYRFFAAAMVLFVLQIVAGILTVHDFLGLTRVLGVETAEFLPITITRGWHLQLALLWITACWIGASLFLLSTIHRAALPGQLAMARLMFWLVILLVAGMLAGVWLGPMKRLGESWNLLGNQGWEFVELGKLWQVVLLAVFALWATLIGQTVLRVRHEGDAWMLPKWLFYAVLAISLLFLSAFVAKPTTNFVIADFWRWAVIHMWAEAFFEVFTTVLLAYVMYLTGFVSHAAASRVVYLATLLFLGSGLLGISHNFYWNAKPVATLAVGGIFSTLQVVPLVLLTLEAWAFRSTQRRAQTAGGFAQADAFLFLLGVNFWNFLGAGVFGFIINLPIVNYYEHGTYLTVNHGHSALMGVYGNLALAAILFCSRYLIAAEQWPTRLIRRAFWSINGGLALMVVLDLFPVGVDQLRVVLEHGLAAARAQAYVQGELFQTLTWARIAGGALFVLGGVLPLAWFVLSRTTRLKAAVLKAAVEVPDGPRAAAPVASLD
ncbi:MAG TPA: cbb3-type cytochrome c oxidase subunit I [Steroidobacter sp.]|uniref:cbb3-type cytochrome c oxidase subunit I n=1 Tax=Steroidobacter sp. TaxID=1978227 RepID=UPI002ED91C09